MSQKSAYEAPQKEFSFSLLLLPYLEQTGHVWELSLVTSFKSHFSPKLFPLCIPFYNYSHFWYKKYSNTIIKATDPLSREKSILSKNVFQWRWWICASLCNDPSFLYGKKKKKKKCPRSLRILFSKPNTSTSHQKKTECFQHHVALL